jgi:hypothetical protein
MFDHERFDGLARDLATNRLSRGQVLKGLAASMVGAFLGSTMLDTRARPAFATGTSCAKQSYSTGTNFIGQAITADVQFFDSLNDIDSCAGANNVDVYVTSSYRPPGTRPNGAIVDPAKQSNHEAGHAIDMNVSYTNAAGQQVLCGCEAKKGCPSSTCLGGVLPAPVQGFIDCVKAAGLHWGGDFKRSRDPVHIDDHLKEGNFASWQDRANAMVQSAPCPATETCDVHGECQCPPGLTSCSGKCVDLQTDLANCSSCGNACPGEKICQGGLCVCPFSCEPPKVPNDTCQECVCPPGQIACGDECILIDATCCPAGQIECVPGKCCLPPHSIDGVDQFGCRTSPDGQKACCFRNSAGQVQCAR